MPLDYYPPFEMPDSEYPFLLDTGRALFHHHTGTMTRRVKGLNQFMSEEKLQINPADAAALGINDGDMLSIASRRGRVKARACVTDVTPAGTVYMTFHFSETPSNLLTSPARDAVSHTPEYKACAVRVEKIKLDQSDENQPV
jgi:predicted molibdopterin-dependent oxidoreductase YjgC